MFSKCAHWLALFAALSTALPQPIAAQALPPDMRVQLEEMTNVLADIADATSDGADLPGTVLRAVGSDAAALVDYVGNGIAYVPYTGVLRGADGTLRSGYGNSYDQSLALITLLRRAGYEAQILVGPETEGAFSTTRQDFPAPDNDAEVQDLIAELEDLIQDLVDSGAIDAPPALLEPDVAEFDPTIAPQAAAAAVDLLNLSPVTPTPEAADIYALVRYRHGPSDPWAYADPAKNVVTEDLDTNAYLKLNDQVPSEHQHRTQVTVVVEAAQSSVPVATLEAPAANLGLRPMSFSLVPTDMILAAEAGLTFAADQDLVFASETLPQVVITLEGDVIPIDLAASAYAGVFQTGADLMGGASNLLDTGETAARPLFDRILYRVTTISPGGADMRSAERVLIERRIVEELIEDDDPNALRSALLAAASGSVLLYSGVAPRVPYERDAAHLRNLSSFLTVFLDDTEIGSVSRAATSLSDMFMHNALAELVTDMPTAAHRSSSVAALRTMLLATPDSEALSFSLMTDILIDGRFASDPIDALTNAVEAAMREDAFVNHLSKSLDLPDLPYGSFDALQTSVDQRNSPITLAAFLEQTPAEQDVERSAQIAFLEAQHAAGNAIAIWPGTTATETVWLEFDPKAGSARLASGTGAGQSKTEYAAVLIPIVVGAVIAAIGIKKCGDGPAGKFRSCANCEIAGFAIGVATGGVGIYYQAAATLVKTGLVFGAAQVAQKVAC